MAHAGEVSARSITDLVDRGQIDQALADARRLTTQMPADPAAWRALAYAETGLKAFKEAEQALRHAISLAPKDAPHREGEPSSGSDHACQPCGLASTA